MATKVMGERYNQFAIRVTDMLDMPVKDFFKMIGDRLYHTARRNIFNTEAYRASVLERLAKNHGSVGAVPFAEFEREAGITREMEDLGNYIPCCS